jgi:hypothetical protein
MLIQCEDGPGAGGPEANVILHIRTSVRRVFVLGIYSLIETPFTSVLILKALLEPFYSKFVLRAGAYWDSNSTRVQYTSTRRDGTKRTPTGNSRQSCAQKTPVGFSSCTV